MRIKYSRILTLSTKASSQKEAERDILSKEKRLKHIAEAFGLKIERNVGRNSTEGESPFWFEYFFHFHISTVCDFADVLDLTYIIKSFSFFNSFTLGKEVCKIEVENGDEDDF